MCLHEETVVTPEYEIACLQCGEIIGNEFIQEEFIYVDEIEENKSVEVLKDVIANGNFHSDCQYDSMFMFKELRRDKSLKNFKDNELLCYSLYNVCIRNDCSRTPEEISYYFGLDPIIIWKIEKILNQTIILCPTLMISRVMSTLNVPFHLNPEILILIEKIQKWSSAKPGTILACAIWEVTKNLKPKIALSEICKHCVVSPSAVRSLIKRINKISV